MFEVSRRGFLKLGAMLPFEAAEKAPSRSADAQAPSSAPPVTTIDQNPIRRRGVGLRGIDPARACPGLTLFAPLMLNQVHLIDLHGAVVHSWTMPYRQGNYGYLTDRGTLLYNGQVPNDTWLGKQPFMCGSVIEVDWNGKVLRELKRPDHHHDGRLLKNGNLVLLCAAELPDAIAKRVRGGRPGSEVDGKMWGDYIIEVTWDGKVVWEWKAWEHLDPEIDGITALQDGRRVWMHANSLWEDADGSLLVSFPTFRRSFGSIVLRVTLSGSLGRRRCPVSTHRTSWRTATSCCSTTDPTGWTKPFHSRASSKLHRRRRRSSGHIRSRRWPISTARGFRTRSASPTATP